MGMSGNVMQGGRRGDFGVRSAEGNDYFVDPSKDPLRFAFSKKFTVHAGGKTKPVDKSEIEGIVPSLYTDILRNPSVIYVHIPFCQTRCAFCGFAGSKADENISREYVDALIKEMDFICGFGSAGKVPVQAVYIGGGTPSALAPAEVYRLGRALSDKFNLANDCEITLEGRLHDFVPERAEYFIDAGFNRFSIGVQTFNTDTRKLLGRLSSREKVIEVLSSLLEMQKAAVIIDLIYGLPGQSIENFIEDLDTAANVGVDGLDTYQLNIFKNTPLFRMLEEKRVPAAANLDEHGLYYQAAMEHLLGKKWRQLSLSHYARTYRERNIYNPWAKSKGNCMPLGAGAGGNIEGYNLYRAAVPERYYNMASECFFTPDVITRPAAGRKKVSSVIAELEQGYLKLEHLADNLTGIMPVLKNWEEAGLISLDPSYVNLTTAGKFWGVNITQSIIELINKGEENEAQFA